MHLQRDLKNRHLQLIGLGGCIGTALFMGSGIAIHQTGPSILLVYLITGGVLYAVMRAMGELLLSNPKYRSFIDFFNDILGPWAGYVCGYTYALCWIVTIISEMIALASYVQFWLPHLAPWIPITITVLTLLSLNLMTVKLFGETEFWIALIKISTIITLIVVGLGMIVIGFTSPDGHHASLTNLWHDGGFFATGINGIFDGFRIAIFAFTGIELVGTAVAESSNPERNLPKTIKAIPTRILLFYVLALLVIMAISPWHLIRRDQSPFVQVFMLSGIPIAANLINFVVLTAAVSSSNSGIFSVSRMLYGLGHAGHAPPIFSRLSRAAVPAHSLIFSCMCLLLGSILVQVIPNVMTAYVLVISLASVLFIFIWSMILCAYIVYRRRNPHLHQQSNLKMPGGNAMCWLCLAFFAFVVVLLGLKPDILKALLLSPLWFAALGISYWFKNRRHKDRGTI